MLEENYSLEINPMQCYDVRSAVSSVALGWFLNDNLSGYFMLEDFFLRSS